MSPQGLDLQERVIEINRVAKVVKGGRRFSFTALVAVGDEGSVVGIGYGKAREVPLAIQKAVEDARKSLVKVPMYGQTIPHRIIGRYGAGHVVLRPASPAARKVSGVTSSPAENRASRSATFTGWVWVRNGSKGIDIFLCGPRSLRVRMWIGFWPPS